MKSLVNRIKERRKELGISQNAMASFLGITQGAVSQWEVGESQPNFESLVKLCELLETDPNFLLLGAGTIELPSERRITEIMVYLETELGKAYKSLPALKQSKLIFHLFKLRQLPKKAELKSLLALMS